METLKSGLLAIGQFVLGVAILILIAQAIVHWYYILAVVLILGPFWTVMVILGAIFIPTMIVVAVTGGGQEFFEGIVPPIMAIVAIMIIASLLSKHVIIIH